MAWIIWGSSKPSRSALQGILFRIVDAQVVPGIGIGPVCRVSQVVSSLAWFLGRLYAVVRKGTVPRVPYRHGFTGRALSIGVSQM